MTGLARRLMVLVVAVCLLASLAPAAYAGAKTSQPQAGDGQTLSMQSKAVQKTFTKAYGANAPSEWAIQRTSALAKEGAKSGAGGGAVGGQLTLPSEKQFDARILAGVTHLFNGKNGLFAGIAGRVFGWIGTVTLGFLAVVPRLTANAPLDEQATMYGITIIPVSIFGAVWRVGMLITMLLFGFDLAIKAVQNALGAITSGTRLTHVFSDLIGFGAAAAAAALSYPVMDMINHIVNVMGQLLMIYMSSSLGPRHTASSSVLLWTGFEHATITVINTVMVAAFVKLMGLLIWPILLIVLLGYIGIVAANVGRLAMVLLLVALAPFCVFCWFRGRRKPAEMWLQQYSMVLGTALLSAIVITVMMIVLHMMANNFSNYAITGALGMFPLIAVVVACWGILSVINLGFLKVTFGHATAMANVASTIMTSTVGAWNTGKAMVPAGNAMASAFSRNKAPAALSGAGTGAIGALPSGGSAYGHDDDPNAANGSLAAGPIRSRISAAKGRLKEQAGAVGHRIEEAAPEDLRAGAREKVDQAGKVKENLSQRVDAAKQAGRQHLPELDAALRSAGRSSPLSTLSSLTASGASEVKAERIAADRTASEAQRKSERTAEMQARDDQHKKDRDAETLARDAKHASEMAARDNQRVTEQAVSQSNRLDDTVTGGFIDSMMDVPGVLNRGAESRLQAGMVKRNLRMSGISSAEAAKGALQARDALHVATDGGRENGEAESASTKLHSISTSDAFRSLADPAGNIDAQGAAVEGMLNYAAGHRNTAYARAGMAGAMHRYAENNGGLGRVDPFAHMAVREISGSYGTALSPKETEEVAAQMSDLQFRLAGGDDAHWGSVAPDVHEQAREHVTNAFREAGTGGEGGSSFADAVSKILREAAR
ncbi:MAG: hypothetical protein ACYDAG_04290 [Chloroflexota bacterium]